MNWKLAEVMPALEVDDDSPAERQTEIVVSNRFKIDDEIVWFEGLVPNWRTGEVVWQVRRAMEGTQAAPHAAGAQLIPLGPGES
jgi:hypothetical protein